MTAEQGHTSGNVDHGVSIEPIPSQAGPAYHAAYACAGSLPNRAGAVEDGRWHVDQSDASGDARPDGLLTGEQVTRMRLLGVENPSVAFVVATTFTTVTANFSPASRSRPA